jgi:predicted DCC family thiol-disulfide oxidoreductase YuxK
MKETPPSGSPSPAGGAFPVLMYDGDCGLCNRLVRLLLRLDRGRRLHFAPLQGPSAQAWLRERGLPTTDFETLIFLPDWERRGTAKHLVRTDGVTAALRTMQGRTPRFIAAVIAIFPAALRDGVYRVVGRLRYRVFGPWRPRPLPRPEWAARFLP